MDYTVDAGDFDIAESYLYPNSDSEYESSGERFRGRNRVPPRVNTSTGRPLSPPAGGGNSNFVTQAQLDLALARARGEIKANADAIKTVDGRVRTIVGDMQRLQTNTQRDLTRLQSDLRTTQTLSALIPLVATGNSTLARIAPLAHLLPAGALGNATGGTQAGGGNILGGNNNLIAIAAIAYAAGAFDDEPAKSPKVA